MTWILEWRKHDTITYDDNIAKVLKRTSGQHTHKGFQRRRLTGNDDRETDISHFITPAEIQALQLKICRIRLKVKIQLHWRWDQSFAPEINLIIKSCIWIGPLVERIVRHTWHLVNIPFNSSTKYTLSSSDLAFWALGTFSSTEIEIEAVDRLNYTLTLYEYLYEDIIYYY